MKKYAAVIPMIFAVLLSGCTSELEDRCNNWLSETAARDAISFTADVTAEYPDGEISFTLCCSEDGAGGAEVEVLAPEIISGIKAHIAPDSSQLIYDGVILDTGDLDGWGLTPMSAMPKLIEAVRNGALESFERDGERITLSLASDDHIVADITLDGMMVPISAELLSDGRTVVLCKITEWK